jgi:acetyl-CoA synthetase
MVTDPYQSFVAARDFLLLHRTDYVTAYQGFTWPQLSEFNWALDYFDRMAASNDRPALWIVDDRGNEQKTSFSLLSERSNRVANWLRKLGVNRGDRVLLMLGNELALWESMLAAIKLGAVLVPTSTLLSCEDLQDRVLRGAVKHVIAGAEHSAKFAAIATNCTRILVGSGQENWHSFTDAYVESPNCEPQGVTKASAPLLLYFTSGTTSKPKLVLHSHSSYPVGHLSTMYWIGLRPNDVHLNISSPGWAKHAWSCFFAPWNAQACVFILNSRRFDASTLLDALQRYQVTTMCAPPTVWRMLIQTDLRIRKTFLREVVGAGEPLNAEVIDQVRTAWGITIRDGFGQTESTCQIGNTPGQEVKAGSMGRPLPGYSIALIDGEGNVADEGELCLSLQPKPLGLMLEYADNAELMTQAIRDGYYRTGDVARIDSAGYVTYVGRADDLFKCSDYRISPFELESVLIEHPAIVEAAVVPSPDPVRLSLPKAFVVLAEGYQATEELARDIFIFCGARLSPFKRIRRLEFASLPKTISGKIRRSELRAMESRRRASGNRYPLEFFEDDFVAGKDAPPITG